MSSLHLLACARTVHVVPANLILSIIPHLAVCIRSDTTLTATPASSLHESEKRNMLATCWYFAAIAKGQAGNVGFWTCVFVWLQSETAHYC